MRFTNTLAAYCFRYLWMASCCLATLCSACFADDRPVSDRPNVLLVLVGEEAYFTNQRLGEIRSLPRGSAFDSPDVADEAYADGRVAAETVRRLKAAEARRDADGIPCIIAAGFARPHLPFSAPKKYWDLYDARSLPMPRDEELQTVSGRPKRITKPDAPNIIVVFIDDMGFTDLSCFGGEQTTTEHIDRLACEGLRFTNFYVNSPICSPSRTALTTGHYPQRWRITSFLNNRQSNKDRGMAQWLDPRAPVLARELQRRGYFTGHFGKWHMGGQRDVGDAPLITEYGFDRSLTNFEGLGPRVLGYKNAFKGGKPKLHHLGSNDLGNGPIQYADRSVITTKFVERAIEHINQAVTKQQPFFINVWPDDVHSPFFPPKELREATDESKRKLYYAVLDALDQQLTPLFDRVRRDEQLRGRTLILLCSDNGHEPGAGMSDPLRGSKALLYEGGIRSPLIVWGPGIIDAKAAGTVNKTSVFSAIDVNRALYALTGTPVPDGVTLDGENVLDTMLGKSTRGRKAPLFFRRPPDRPGGGTGGNKDAASEADAPDLAARDGRWKFLVNYDGSNPQLFDLVADPAESTNLFDKHRDVADRLRKAVFQWNAGLPADAGDPNRERNTETPGHPDTQTPRQGS